GDRRSDGCGYELIGSAAKRSEQLLVPALLVARGRFLGIAARPAGEHRLHRLDDEEEDRRGDRDELDDVRDERAVAEEGVVDREREVSEVGLADLRCDAFELLVRLVEATERRQAEDEDARRSAVETFLDHAPACPSSAASTPGQRTPGGKRPPLAGSKPQVFESP